MPLVTKEVVKFLLLLVVVAASGHCRALCGDCLGQLWWRICEGLLRSSHRRLAKSDYNGFVDVVVPRDQAAGSYTCAHVGANLEGVLS